MSNPTLLGGDSEIGIESHLIEADLDGPRIVVFGGVHGDELAGVLSARTLVRELTDLVRGSVQIVPCANPNAVSVCARESAIDGKNLARCFPGDPSGTYTDRVADLLTTKAISGADALIDLHSGGMSYAMPFFAGYADGLPTSKIAAQMTQAFNAPVSWRHDTLNAGRSLSAAADLGVPAIYVEGGTGGGSLDLAEINGYVGGVRRVLALFGMIEPIPLEDGPAETILINDGNGNSDTSPSTSQSGWCLTAVSAGERVSAGQLIAEVRSDHGEVLERIEAPTDGVVMLIRTIAAVEADDVIVMLAPDSPDVTSRA